MSQRQPPNGRTDGRSSRPEPANQLDIQAQVLEPTTVDSLLRRLNMGLGNYGNREYWQQVEAFQNHLFADSAFGGTILDLAIYQTMWELGRETVEDDDDHDDQSKREAILDAGRERWESLGEEAVGETEWAGMNPDKRQERLAREQQLALEEHAGITEAWMTPHARMIAVRHEGSRSKQSRLLDNITGRIRKIVGRDSTDSTDIERLGGDL